MASMRRVVRMHVDQRGGAARGRDDVVRLQSRLQTRCHQLCLDVDHARYRLMSMVRGDDQQHVVSSIPQPVNRLDHTGGIGVGLSQHREVFGRAEWPLVLRGVGLAHP
jgi:hypothetical protein